MTKRLPKKAIGDAAIQVFARNHTSAVMWGDVFLLDEIASASGMMELYRLHPLERHKRILDALGRDMRFEKRMVKVEAGRWGGRVRLFKVIGESNGTEHTGKHGKRDYTPAG